MSHAAHPAPGSDSAHAAGAHDHADIDRHVRAAIFVFAALLVLTGFTVGAYFLHLPKAPAIALALAIATVKGSLVAAWFMHLVSERKLIIWMLILAASCFIPLLLFPTFTMLGGIPPR
jgi:caa(3)-type oxidase subunit IV